MNSYQKALIEEHSNLIVRINKLNTYIYSDQSDKDDKIEFANKCMQLSSMRQYEDALHARLMNAGIVFECGRYLEKVAEIQQVPLYVESEHGNDYDADSEKLTDTQSNANE